MRYWVYDGQDLMRKFGRLEEATHFAKLRGYQIVKKPRPKNTIDFTKFEEALF
jgi:hypothetical protein